MLFGRLPTKYRRQLVAPRAPARRRRGRRRRRRRSPCHNRANLSMTLQSHPSSPPCGVGRSAWPLPRSVALAVALAWAPAQRGAVAPPKLEYQRFTLPQRPDRHPPRGPLDADCPRADLVSRRLEERTDGPHRLRPPVRAHDVQGLEERRTRAAHLDRRVGRRPRQRLHHRGRDGLLEHRAVAVPAAGAVDGSRPHRLAAHRREDLRQRARSGQGRAPDAHREPAVRAAERDSSTSTPSPPTPTSIR